MSAYLCRQTYRGHRFASAELHCTDFEQCTFYDCDFSACHFTGLRFIDCRFVDCRFEGAGIHHTAFRGVVFEGCNLKNLNFAMCDPLLFALRFEGCRLDYSRFYALRLKETLFARCSLVAVDFMGAQLGGAVFADCDLYRAEFAQADLREADLRGSMHYNIDPKVTKIRGARFSRGQVAGLLFQHRLVIA